jgi:hypothetical protein
MNRIHHAIALASLLLATGCASIVSKTSREVDLRSDPTGVRVAVIDETGKPVFDGKTPTVVKLKTGKPYFGKKSYTITFSQDGYHQHTATIQSTLNGWYFGNLGFGGLIGFLVVDPLTGAMWRFDEKEVVARLAPIQASAPGETELRIVEWNQVPDDLRSSLVRIN